MSSVHFIFDLDNCIADDSWRIPKIDWTEGLDPDARYAPYHASCGDDAAANLTTMKALTAMPGAHFVFFTARPDSVRHQTRDWLRKHIEPVVGADRLGDLYMRRNGDHRSAVEIKREALAALRGGLGDCDSIGHAFDDHEGIVAMYREEGVQASVLKIHSLDAYNPPSPPTVVHWTDIGECVAADPISTDISEQFKAPFHFDMLTPVDQLGPRQREHAEPESVLDVLKRATSTFETRNALYGDGFMRFGPLMMALFPDGPPALATESDWNRLGVVVQLASKLLRYTTNFDSGGHLDSAHDSIVYAAILEFLTSREESSS